MGFYVWKYTWREGLEWKMFFGHVSWPNFDWTRNSRLKLRWWLLLVFRDFRVDDYFVLLVIGCLGAVYTVFWLIGGCSVRARPEIDECEVGCFANRDFCWYKVCDWVYREDFSKWVSNGCIVKIVPGVNEWMIVPRRFFPGLGCLSGCIVRIIPNDLRNGCIAKIFPSCLMCERVYRKGYPEMIVWKGCTAKVIPRMIV